MRRFSLSTHRRSDVFVVGLALRGRAIIYICNDDTLVIDWPLAEWTRDVQLRNSVNQFDCQLDWEFSVRSVLSRSKSLGFGALVAALGALALSGPMAAQRADAPFVGLTGAWSGAGQVRLEGGKTERISCKAYYTPRDGGAGVGISLRCASTSFSIHLRSTVASSGGRVTGDWEESTFGASGNVTGRATPGNLAVAISGGGLNGSMSVSFGGSTQQVSINTSGTALKGVSISLSKS